MGFYWQTLLCSGKFTDEKNAEIKDKFVVGGIDPIIESHEWARGWVDKAEFENFLKKFQGKIKLMESQNEEDLFLAESVCTTLEITDEEPKYKYVLIAKNCTFEKFD